MFGTHWMRNLALSTSILQSSTPSVEKNGTFVRAVALQDVVPTGTLQAWLYPGENTTFSTFITRDKRDVTYTTFEMIVGSADRDNPTPSLNRSATDASPTVTVLTAGQTDFTVQSSDGPNHPPKTTVTHTTTTTIDITDLMMETRTEWRDFGTEPKIVTMTANPGAVIESQTTPTGKINAFGFRVWGTKTFSNWNFKPPTKKIWVPYPTSSTLAKHASRPELGPRVILTSPASALDVPTSVRIIPQTTIKTITTTATTLATLPPARVAGPTTTTTATFTLHEFSTKYVQHHFLTHLAIASSTMHPLSCATSMPDAPRHAFLLRTHVLDGSLNFQNLFLQNGVDGLTNKPDPTTWNDFPPALLTSDRNYARWATLDPLTSAVMFLTNDCKVEGLMMAREEDLRKAGQLAPVVIASGVGTGDMEVVTGNVLGAEEAKDGKVLRWGNKRFKHWIVCRHWERVGFWLQWLDGEAIGKGPTLEGEESGDCAIVELRIEDVWPSTV